MNLTDSRLAQAGNERLELAMLSFFEQFRKIYIGDQVQKSSKVIQQIPNSTLLLFNGFSGQEVEKGGWSGPHCSDPLQGFSVILFYF